MSDEIIISIDDDDAMATIGNAANPNPKGIGQPRDSVRLYIKENKLDIAAPFVHYVYIQDGVKIGNWNETE